MSQIFIYKAKKHPIVAKRA